MFDWIIGALKWDQIDGRESFYLYKKISTHRRPKKTIWETSRWNGIFLGGLECFHVVCDVSRWSGMFPDGLKYFKVICKGVKYTGIFPDSFNSGLKKTIRKVSRCSGNFPVCLESIQLFGKCSDILESSPSIWQASKG